MESEERISLTRRRIRSRPGQSPDKVTEDIRDYSQTISSDQLIVPSSTNYDHKLPNLDQYEEAQYEAGAIAVMIHCCSSCSASSSSSSPIFNQWCLNENTLNTFRISPCNSFTNAKVAASKSNSSQSILNENKCGSCRAGGCFFGVFGGEERVDGNKPYNDAICRSERLARIGSTWLLQKQQQQPQQELPLHRSPSRVQLAATIGVARARSATCMKMMTTTLLVAMIAVLLVGRTCYERYTALASTLIDVIEERDELLQKYTDMMSLMEPLPLLSSDTDSTTRSTIGASTPRFLHQENSEKHIRSALQSSLRAEQRRVIYLEDKMKQSEAKFEA